MNSFFSFHVYAFLFGIALLFNGDAHAQVTQRTTIYNDFSGTFTQEKSISVLPKPLKSHGSFQFSYQDFGPHLIWKTLSPIESVLTFDRQGVRQDVEGDTVWNISADRPAVSTLTEVITAILSSNWKVLDDYFEIRMPDLSKKEGEEKPIKRQGNIVVELKSREANLQSVITSMTILLNPVASEEKVTGTDDKETIVSYLDSLSNINSLVQQIIMYEANSDQTRIKFFFDAQLSNHE
ncbi:MAG: outer membrane lipoprotein carrier protein LolA [Cellvibrionaceae bacterium]